MFLDFLKGFWNGFQIILIFSLGIAIIVTMQWWPWWVFVILAFLFIPTWFGINNAYKTYNKKKYNFYLEEIKKLEKEKDEISDKMYATWFDPTATNIAIQLNDRFKEVTEQIAYNTEMLSKYK